ncbi:LytTR family DNA-binding domain-containing protein [Dysgonomonas sp. BGC7]|uniref:LytR/AlgR family response regulator transcription factor n=1 Tax=Dysgonomonas sp. BGC7 TaxID=1658008 RepID=UPI000681ADC6|nr:LytTR family DNA-binding domain-containing protein [Dysgonomonas sp. BGC7]
MRLYNYIIVEDNEMELLILKINLQKYPFLQCLKTFTDATSAYFFLKNNPVDIVFSDIQMPDLNGLDLLNQSKESITSIVYITSYTEHALEAFGLGVTDYIIKPIDEQRLDSCILRLKDYLDLKYKSNLFDLSNSGDSIKIKQSHETINIKIHEIIYLEALKDYTKIVTLNKSFVTRQLLKYIMEELGVEFFIRIHKSFAVQAKYIQSVDTGKVKIINNISLPIGRAYKQNLREFIK